MGNHKPWPLFHDIEATGVKVDLQLTNFIKALYPTIYMMKRIKNSLFLEMLSFLNLIKMQIVLTNNFPILIDFNQKNSIMNGIMNFQLLKGGFPF